MPVPDIDSRLKSFMPVSLVEMDAIKLMNRMDMKFAFAATFLPALLEKLSPHYRILEINDRRCFRYDTRYLDTEKMLFYIQHLTGKLARYKVRFRKYDSTGITYLEVKKKTNKNRTVKWRIENNSGNGTLDDSATQFITRHITTGPFSLRVSLDSRFRRFTLADLRSQERITIDTSLSYSLQEGGSKELPFLAVAEIKSEGYPSLSPFVMVARQIGIRPTSFSKYCMGNALLNEAPKKNILKPKFLLLNKIENEFNKTNAS